MLCIGVRGLGCLRRGLCEEWGERKNNCGILTRDFEICEGGIVVIWFVAVGGWGGLKGV